MNKKIIFIGVIILIVSASAYFFLNNKKDSSNDAKQGVLSDTLSISQEYSRLQYQTDNVLVNAKNYPDYDGWNNEMTLIIEDWKTLESNALKLEEDADKLANEKTTFNLFKNVYAYDSVEIQKVIEGAPMGKQVRTLAKHLGVDAKRAHLILNESQNRISREIWGGEGDVYQGLEQDAMRIKNGAKVTVFVGGVVLTGGTSALAASGALAKTAVVVSGADLVLEVADDEAKIALGDKNKVSEMVGKVRTVTEPAASILTIVNMPGNLSKAMEKISAISFVGDQIRSVVQDEKILGISIKTDEKGEIKAVVSGLTEAELAEWRKENKVTESSQTVEEIFKQFEEETKEEVKTVKDSVNNNDSIAGEWVGTIKFTASASSNEEQKEYSLSLNSDGTIGKTASGGFNSWKKEGNLVKLFIDSQEAEVYDEYVLSGDTLTFVKRAGINSDGEWQEDYAGSDFFGGKFMEISLKKVK